MTVEVPVSDGLVSRRGAPAEPLVIGAEGNPWTAGRLSRLALLFILPTALACLYYGFLAADVYVSESQFIVRSQGQASGGLLGGTGEEAGISLGTADVNSVIAYIRSRDALKAVEGRVDLRSAFGWPAEDFLGRFPGLLYSSSTEGLYEFYLSRVRADHDGATGITALSVRAFDPVTAQAISRVLLDEAERIVNGLSERMRNDTLAQAEIHVTDARRQLIAAQDALQQWRSREQQYDPSLYSKSVVDVVTSLSIAIAEARARRKELADTSPRNPEIAILDTKIASIEAEIRTAWLSLAGESASLAPRISAYERLVIDRELAVKLYAAASESLERTRAEVRRQSVFLERIAEPQQPDRPRYPYRLLGMLAAGVLSFMVFLIVDRLAHNVARHARLARHREGPHRHV